VPWSGESKQMYDKMGMSNATHPYKTPYGEIRWEYPPISSNIINKAAFLYILFYINILYFMPSF
jgi:hypothetical protein